MFATLSRFVAFICFFFPLLLAAQPAGIIVNEISQGTTAAREFAELVVVGPPCTTVDLRGWIIDDNNGEFIDCAGPNNGALAGAGIAPGHIRFSLNAVWSEVPVGTIILVYAFDPGDAGAQAEIGGLAVDYTDSNCDLVRVVPLNASNLFMEMNTSLPVGASSGCCPNGVGGNPNYTPATYVPLNNQAFSGITGKLGMANGGDAFQTRQPGGNFFHGLSYGAPSTSGCSPTPTFDGGPFGVHISPSGSNLCYQFVNILNDDFNNVSNYVSLTAAAFQSPGEPNNCDNAQWIASLRRPPESAFEGGIGCLPNPTAAPQSICVGQQITLTLPNNNTCSSNTFSWMLSGAGTANIVGPNNTNSLTIQATGAGALNVTVTATLSNTLLYTQGGCSGPTFPSSLTYTFPVTINPGPSAFPTSITACGTGGVATFNLTSVNNTVNGGTGFTVNWFSNPAGTIPVANPMALTTASTTVYAQVTNAGCNSGIVAVSLIVQAGPPAFPALLYGCNEGAGLAFFDLTAASSTINGGTGQAVSFWTNAAGTIPVPNPMNFSSPNGTVFATVSNGVCNSSIVPISLVVVADPTTANAFINVSPTSACGSATVTVTFVLPSPATYNVSMQYGSPANGFQTYTANDINSLATATFNITETTQFILTTVGLSNNPYCNTSFANPLVQTVTISDPPNLQISGNTTICQGESIDLSAIVSDLNNPGLPITFHTGNPATPGNQTGPVVSPNANTTFFAFANAGPGCTQTLPVAITVDVPATPALTAASLCDSDPALDLNTLEDPAFPNGSWSGPGVSGNSFDPAGQSGTVTLTFTSSEPCTNPANVDITVNPSGAPALGTASLCDTDPVLDLNTLEDPAFPNGAWSGPGVSGTNFDPSGQNGTVTLTFTPSDPCAAAATADIAVNPSGTPVLGAATLCQTDGLFDLTTLEDAAFPNGSWSGPGVSGTNFDPAGQTGSVQLTFTPTDPCTNAANTSLTVNAPTLPILGAQTLCVTDQPLDLNTLADPAFPNGSWSGPGVSGNTFDPAGQSGAVQITFTPSDPCVQTANTTLTVNESPAVTNLLSPCDPTNSFYTVSFDITGGDPLSYTVDGLPSGSSFTSANIPSGTPYTFLVDDANGCGPVTVSGSVNCLCATSAGTLDLSGAPLVVCEGDPFSVTALYNNDAILDGNDILQFGLFDGATLLVTSNTGDFTFPGGVNFNQPYTVSAIVGNDDGTGNVNLNDPCLSISAGLEVVFQTLGLTASAGASLCADACFDWTLSLSGLPPFVFDFSENGSPVQVTIFQNDTTLVFCQPGGGNLSLAPLALSNDFCTLDLSAQPAVDVTFFALPQTLVDPTLCPGEELTVNGTVYNEANPAGTEIFPGGSFQGCDSTVTVDLSFFPPAQSDLIQTLCTGGSLTVNGTVYDESNPSGTEVFPGGSFNGCDSTVNILLTFTAAVTEILEPTLCPGGEVTVNGVVYNQANPVGSETFPNGSFLGCDSIVQVNLSFFAPATGSLSQTLCEGESLLVNGTLYDQSNPAGTELFPGGSVDGCDSTLSVSLSFFAPAVGDLVQTLCTGSSLTVNGTVYDEANPAGTEILAGASFNGCDSTVNIQLSFTPAVTEILAPTLCPGEEVTVNGAVYNQANPIGSETFPNGSFLGCDSIVQVNLSFFAPATGSLSQTLCEGESILINGTLYDQSNPAGTELFPGGSVDGCDSTLSVNLSFFAPAVGDLVQTLCTGSSLTVNGTVYDEANPAGTEILAGASFNGCDSTVNIQLSFTPAVTEILAPTLCPGEEVTVNGAVYNQANPIGTETFPGGSFLGCDSIVQVNLSFFAPAAGSLSQTLCPGESLTVNGTVYDQLNPSGTEVLPGASFNGCDSILTVALSFFPPAASALNQTLCLGQSVTINGTVYNESNPAGTEIIAGGSFQGCDSTVVIDLDFFPPAQSLVNPTLCEGESISVNGTVYDAANPSGVQILPGASVNGCDSIVSVNIAFFQPALGSLNTTLCDGDFVAINGTVYDAGNPTGTEILAGGSVNGCDSTLNISLTFYPPVVTLIEQTLVSGQSIIVNGTVYDENNPDGTEIIFNGSYLGCDSTIIVDLFFEEFDAIIATESPSCFGLADGLITIEEIFGGKPPYQFSVNGGPFTAIDTLPVTIGNLGAGVYEIIIQDGQGGLLTEEVIILAPAEFTLNLGDDHLIELGESVELEALSNGIISQILWTPNTFLTCDICALTTSFQPTESITYIAAALDGNGCAASDQVRIEVIKARKVFVPNIFSPNFDGINDEFMVFGGPDVLEILEFQVFDRWGDQVYRAGNFQPNDPTYGWNGQFKGKNMNAGVYVYYLEVLFLDGRVEVVKGDVVLAR